MLEQIGKNARAAARKILTANEKNEILSRCASELVTMQKDILEANRSDMEFARENGVKQAFLDRLMLNEDRIKGMADGLLQLVRLDDPVGEAIFSRTLPNGLQITQKRVPFGVIGMIYEARPNVTSDSFGICLKAGSAVILRGGKEAINSNSAIVRVFRVALESLGQSPDFVQLVQDVSRESANEMMRLRAIDVLIPRGGAGLIRNVVENSTVPVIQTGVGNCHVFVDETGNLENAVNIILNAKTQRPGVCNACEKLLVHEKIAGVFLPLIVEKLKSAGVEVRGSADVAKIAPGVVLAAEDDFTHEYEDMIIAVYIVRDVHAAVEHIANYSSGHSESIITENYTSMKIFTENVDSAAVYVNASTRFTDGNEFGFGAEIGISTQKLHARGPMALREMTTTKYIVLGSGQVRS